MSTSSQELLLTTVADRQEHLSNLIRFAMTKDAGLAGLLLWVPIVISKSTLAPAFTDGKKIHYTDEFFLKFNNRQQLFIILHEIMHVAFQHPQRGKRLRLREGAEYDHLLHNVATDAVINYALTQNCRYAEAPPNIIDICDLLNWDDVRNKTYERWTSDELYQYLKKRKREKQKQIDSAMEKLNGKSDLDPENSNTDDPDNHQSNQESRIWYERVKRAQAGSGSNGVLRNFADIPKIKTPWERHLRDFLIARLMPELESSWHRPSRRTLSMSEFMDFAEAGLDRKKGIKMIGIVVDTSGSITDSILKRFMGEINAILEKTGAECILMDCDDQVHQVRRFRGHIPANYKPKGGGGTSFVPAIDEMKKYNPDALVYLTDTYGEFPSTPPSFPVLWATWTEGQVPWGRRIIINDVE